MIQRHYVVTAGLFALLTLACNDPDPQNQPAPINEDAATFAEIASVDLGGTAASEISAYDPGSKRLFTVNNESAAKIDVLDLSALPAVNRLSSIDVSALGGVANSVAVADGKLAIALEATNKQAAGSVVVLNPATLARIQQVTVGALPDMVTFSPNGRYIVTANEGEPNAAYTTDPVGSVSIIDVTNNYSVRTLDFAQFEGQRTTLASNGFRVFGPRASLAQDVEPEYVAISADSRRAFVTLQENNAIAEVDLVAGTIVRLLPLGTRDISVATNALDPSDRDNAVTMATWPIRSYYLPDAIAHFGAGNEAFLITADEGDSRDYTAYSEEARIGTLNLDATRFPNATSLKAATSLGRLIATKSAGDTDGDGDYDVLYNFGGRGFSIFNASTGQRVYETGRTLEDEVVKAGRYDDARSDDKGVEPEGVTVGTINGRPVAFVALERADAIAIYDLSTPTAPKFLQLLPTGDAPEGVLFIPAQSSPTGRSLLITSNEGDGTVKIYQPDRL